MKDVVSFADCLLKDDRILGRHIRTFNYRIVGNPKERTFGLTREQWGAKIAAFTAALPEGDLDLSRTFTAERSQEEKSRSSQVAVGAETPASWLTDGHEYFSRHAVEGSNHWQPYDLVELEAAVTCAQLALEFILSRAPNRVQLVSPEVHAIRTCSSRGWAEGVAILARLTWRLLQRAVSSRIEALTVDYLPFKDEEYPQETFAAELSRFAALRYLTVDSCRYRDSLPELLYEPQSFGHAVQSLEPPRTVLGAIGSPASSLPHLTTFRCYDVPRMRHGDDGGDDGDVLRPFLTALSSMMYVF